MHSSLLLKFFVTAALLGFTASVIALWVIRFSLAGAVRVAHHTVRNLPHTRLPLPPK